MMGGGHGGCVPPTSTRLQQYLQANALPSNSEAFPHASGRPPVLADRLGGAAPGDWAPHDQ